MICLELPATLTNFLKKMEKVHSFGAAIPNVVHYLISNTTLTQPKKSYLERGFVTNIGLYLCGSDIEMIILQAAIIPLVTYIHHKKKNKLTTTIRTKIRYNLVLRTIIVSYVRICLALFINIFNVLMINSQHSAL